MDWCYVVNVTASPEIYTLSLHDALPISRRRAGRRGRPARRPPAPPRRPPAPPRRAPRPPRGPPPRPRRSEEHTSELQSRQYLVFCLLLELITTIFNNSCLLTYHNETSNA